MTIQEIAYSLNFPSASFFGKYFRRYVGMSRWNSETADDFLRERHSKPFLPQRHRVTQSKLQIMDDQHERSVYSLPLYPLCYSVPLW